MTQAHQKTRMASNETAPLSFGVVILPPIRTELGMSQDVEMHQYSDIFNLEHQQHFYMKHKNCYITDKVTFERAAEGRILAGVEGCCDRISITAQRTLHGP